MAYPGLAVASMVWVRSKGVLVALLGLAAVGPSGCQAGHGRAVLFSAPVSTGASLTASVDDAAPGGGRRRLQFLQPTQRVRIIVEAQDLATPFTQDVDLVAGKGLSVNVQNVPPGDRRIITFQWINSDGTPIDGLYFRAVGPISLGENILRFNNSTTAEAEILKLVIKKNPAAAAEISLADLNYLVGEACRTLGVPNGRLLNHDVIAEIMPTVNAKNYPTPAANWAVAPGYVAVTFKDYAPGQLVIAGVTDNVSGSGETRLGESLLLGPIVPRTAPYKLRILAPGAGPDMAEQQLDVTVAAGQTVKVAPISFVKSSVGTALPDRVGRGGVATVGEDLWLLSPLQHPDVAPTALALTTPVVPSGQSYRFRRSDKWTKPLALPATFPIYGAATAVHGTKIFSFGGFVNAANPAPGADVQVIETAGTAALQAARKLPSSPTQVRLAEAVAGTIGDKIYVTGGQDQDGGLSVATHIYDPLANTWAIGPDLPKPLFAAAVAVADTKMIVVGGARLGEGANDPDEILATTQVFDSVNARWINGSPDMPTPRQGAAAVTVDGKVWVIGGQEAKGSPSRAVEVFDPAVGTWTRRAPLRTPRAFPAAGVVKDGANTRIVVAGGGMGLDPDGFPLPVAKDAVEEIAP